MAALKPDQELNLQHLAKNSQQKQRVAEFLESCEQHRGEIVAWDMSPEDANWNDEARGLDYWFKFAMLALPPYSYSFTGNILVKHRRSDSEVGDGVEGQWWIRPWGMHEDDYVATLRRFDLISMELRMPVDPEHVLRRLARGFAEHQQDNRDRKAELGVLLQRAMNLL